jgi:hypothetical protein
VRRALSAAGALAALWCSPAAQADTFTVTDPGDTLTPGTLRHAVEARAAADPVADTVNFSPGLASVVLGSPVVAGSPVAITDAEGDVELRGGASPLLRFAAGSGGSSVRGVRLSRPGGTGIEVANGVGPVTVQGLPAVAATTALALGPGANGGLGAPVDSRVVRGRAGGLVLTGTAPAAGGIDLYRGLPSASTGAGFAAALGVAAGGFAVALPFEVSPGAVLSATLSAAQGTSAFAAVAVPGDLTSPTVLGAVAVSQTEVRLQLSEPVDPASLQPEDFELVMAGRARTVSALTPGAGGATVLLTSSTSWRAGEAGIVRVRATGAVADVAGNESGGADFLRVAASPGDVVEPFASSLRVQPRSVCLAKGRRCRRPGALVRFIASEESRATLVVQRGNRRVGVRKYDARVGTNRIRFDGRVGGRKLRQGVYRLMVYLEDAVGNQTEDPPLQRFSVRRTTGR